MSVWELRLDVNFRSASSGTCRAGSALAAVPVLFARHPGGDGGRGDRVAVGRLLRAPSGEVAAIHILRRCKGDGFLVNRERHDAEQVGSQFDGCCVLRACPPHVFRILPVQLPRVPRPRDSVLRFRRGRGERHTLGSPTRARTTAAIRRRARNRGTACWTGRIGLPAAAPSRRVPYSARSASDRARRLMVLTATTRSISGS